MFCSHRGKQIDDDSVFCGYCGAVSANNPSAKPDAPAAASSESQSAFAHAGICCNSQTIKCFRYQIILNSKELIIQI